MNSITNNHEHRLFACDECGKTYAKPLATCCGVAATEVMVMSTCKECDDCC